MERIQYLIGKPKASSGRVGRLRETLECYLQSSGRDRLTLGANQIEVSLDNVQDDASFSTWLTTQWQESYAEFQDDKQQREEKIVGEREKLRGLWHKSDEDIHAYYKQKIKVMELERELYLLEQEGQPFSVTKLMRSTRRGNLGKVLALLGDKTEIVAQRGEGNGETITYSDEEILQHWGTWRPEVRNRILQALQATS